MNIKEIKKYCKENNIILVDAEIPLVSYSGRIMINVIEWEKIEKELRDRELEQILNEVVKKEIIHETIED